MQIETNYLFINFILTLIKKHYRSWSSFIFESTDVILDLDIIQNFAYIVIKRNDGVYLEKMNLKANEVDTNLDFSVLLDRKTSVTGVYNSGTNLTTWTLPYPETATRSVVLGGNWSTNFRGRSLQVNQASNTTLTATEITRQMLLLLVGILILNMNFQNFM